MPNWCTNVATINHGDKTLIDAIETELKKEKPELFQMLRPRPPEFNEGESWYAWNIDNWGTKWEANIYNYERVDDNNIKISFDTAWGPCVSLYEYLFENGYDTTAYYEEGGMAFCGKYEFGEDYYYDYSGMNSETMKEELPSDLDEMFGLSERMADQEAEDNWCNDEDIEDEDDEEDTEPNWELEYGFTDWFPKKIKPVRTGIYEVSTDSWPFPQKCEWDGKKWNHLGGAKITQWRGLAVDPESKFNTASNHLDLEKALKELKEEFDRLQTN